MKTSFPLMFACMVLLAGSTHAIDPTPVDRRIDKEPLYASRPRYCLLVFGPEAKTRVWLVHDGDALYVDRNANADLTESGDRVVANGRDLIEPEEGGYLFLAGDIHDGKLTHKQLKVSVTKASHLAGPDEQVNAYLAKNPQGRAYRVGIDVEIPNLKGVGLGGRVEQMAGPLDITGVLNFADRPSDAPIIHFAGPWQVKLLDRQRLTVGRTADLILQLGASGIGPGTSARMGYEGIIPEGAFPTAEISYPSGREGDPPIKKSYELRERCCTYNLYGPILVPETVGVGKARVTISFNRLWEGWVATSHYELDVVAPKTNVKREPVSSAYRRSLVHPAKSGAIVGLRYSPDGRRLIAGDYHGGVIQVWDVETGRQLTKIETGCRDRRDYFFVSPDWSSVYVGRMKQQVAHIEKEGKKVRRYDFEGDVRVWDLVTGELRHTLQHDPPRGILGVALSPNGATLATFEMFRSEWGETLETSASLWDLGTNRFRPLPGELDYWAVYSRDGRTLAAPAGTQGAQEIAVKLFDTATTQQKFSIPIREKNCRLGYIAFSPDARVLVGQVRSRDSQSGKHWLKFWDATNGQEMASIEGEKKHAFLWIRFSPDGRTLAVTNLLARDDAAGNQGKLFLFDVPTRKLAATFNLGQLVIAGEPAYSPDGKWLALSTQRMVGWPRELDPDPMELPQPRILLVDVTAVESRDTLVGPPGNLATACFSPDGKTLATTGDGTVLLWDVTAAHGNAHVPGNARGGGLE